MPFVLAPMRALTLLLLLSLVIPFASAQATPPGAVGIDVAPSPTSDVPPGTIRSPDTGRHCTPQNVVCAGPLQSMTLVETPGIPSQQPPVERAGASADTSGTRAPTFEETTIGPFTIEGIPVVICASTCAVPVGVTDTGAVSIVLTLYVDDIALVQGLP